MIFDPYCQIELSPNMPREDFLRTTSATVAPLLHYYLPSLRPKSIRNVHSQTTVDIFH